MKFKATALALGLCALASGLCAFASGARAQSYIRITSCGDPKPPAGASSGYMDVNGNICTSASGGAGGNATIIAPLGSQLKAASVSVALPSDQTVPVNLITTAAAPTVGASGAITSLQLDASPTAAGVKHFHAENATTASGYCILYNATAAPAPGALTANLVLKFQLLPPNGYCDWQANSVDPPIAASAGAVVLISSAATPYTYTTGVISGSIEGLAQ